MDRPDPFYVVRDEVVKSLAQAKAEYTAWRNEVSTKSNNVKAVETALRETIRNIDWDLEDLQETILIVEKNPAKFFISPDELHSRQNFVHDVKLVVRSVKDHLFSLPKTNDTRSLINFDVVFKPALSNGNSKQVKKSVNGFTPSHKPGVAQSVAGLTDQLKASREDSDGLLMDQAVMMREQDEHLDQLSTSISRLKDMSHRIGGELGDQVTLLDDFGEEMVRTESRMDHTIKRAARLLHIDSDRSQWCALGVLLLTLLIIIILFAVL